MMFDFDGQYEMNPTETGDIFPIIDNLDHWLMPLFTENTNSVSNEEK